MISSLLISLMALGIPVVLLQHRKKRWLNHKVVWLVCTGLAIIGFLGLISISERASTDKLIYYSFLGPLIYWSFDRIFRKISFRLLKRDFIACIRFSEEMNTSWGARNPHVKLSDRLFPLGLAIIMLLNFILPLVLVY